MQQLEQLVNQPQMSRGRWTNNTEIAPEIIKFLEDEVDLQPFFVKKPMNNVLSKSFRIQKEEGIAVQIAGNSEVPRAEDVEKLFTVFLMRIATGYRVDDDDKRINADEPGFEAKKMQRAMERLMKKQRLDITNVFKAAAQGTMTYPSTGITVSSIRDAVNTMIQVAEHDFVQPDTIFMSYQNFRALQTDPNFKYVPEIFQRILIEGRISPGASRQTYSGYTGQSVDGLEVYICNELGTDVILLDSTKESLWLCEDQAPTITKYRDDEHISDIVDIRYDYQPVCVRPECLYKMSRAP